MRADPQLSRIARLRLLGGISIMTRSSKVIEVLTPLERVKCISQKQDGESYPDFGINVRVASSLAEVPSLIADADVFVGHVFNAEIARNADRLKLIQVIGAGFEGVDLAAVPKGVTVCNNYEHENAVAEWVLMAMLALDRQLLAADRTLRGGSWEMSGRHGMSYPGLEGRTVGVIGMGRIGKRVIELAKAFRMNTMAATRTPISPDTEFAKHLDVPLSMADIDTLFEQSDFVVLCVALNDDTRGLIDPRALSLMKSTSHLINIARGEVVDEEALYNALVERRIAGAALDVWWNEPVTRESSPAPSQFPYHQLEHVLMSPHASAVTQSMIDARMKFLSEQMGRLARGEPLRNIVHVG
jgi:phosphoglycerate dehydrogenase-like enzyme